MNKQDYLLAEVGITSVFVQGRIDGCMAEGDGSPISRDRTRRVGDCMRADPGTEDRHREGQPNSKKSQETDHHFDRVFPCS